MQTAMGDLFDFESRRSVVVCKHGCVASSNPLASQAGLDVGLFQSDGDLMALALHDRSLSCIAMYECNVSESYILKAGGNAADAAVAVAAALNVTEPTSTGIGGDAFCLFYDASTKTVKGLNGSGRSAAAATIEKLNSEGYNKDHHYSPIHGHSVTVPGAASAWVDTVSEWGSKKLSLHEILKPAIEMAETGFPVQEITSQFWERGTPGLQRKDNVHGHELLLNGKAPGHGDLMKNPNLASTFKELATHGKDGFYKGRIAQAVADVVQKHGGLISVEDMAAHEATWDNPISTVYKGCRVWELPPNGQGIAALIALNILEGFDLKSMGHNSTQYLHHLIEGMRLAFADTIVYCADPAHVDIPVDQLLSKDYAAKRRELIQPDKVIPVSNLQTDGLSLPTGNDTVYFTTADKEGNACSFINSNYMGFGTALVPEGCGFTLQNRGFAFSLDPSHRNALAPRKRPYHTIIPSMVTSADTNELLMSYGVMGGYMQPQGHVQVLLNMLEFQNHPQRALDLPRFCLGSNMRTVYASNEILNGVQLEKGIPDSVVSELATLGHNPIVISGLMRALFGRGQVISRGPWWRDGLDKPSSSLYWAGSDPRADGLVAAY